MGYMIIYNMDLNLVTYKADSTFYVYPKVDNIGRHFLSTQKHSKYWITMNKQEIHSLHSLKEQSERAQRMALFSGISLSLGYKYLPLLNRLSHFYYVRFLVQMCFIAVPFCVCQQYYYQATRRQLDTL